MAADPGRSILVICPLPDEVLRDLADAFAVRCEIFAGVPDRVALANALEDRTLLLTTVSAPLPQVAIAALPATVRAIATYSVGHEHLALEAARSRGIAVFNTPDVLTDAVADIGMFLILGAARRASEAIALLRSRQWSGWTARQLNGVELTGKTLGIFGMGRIGRAVARRARAFGMAIHYANRHRLAAADEDGARFHAVAEDMLEACDVLLVAAPSSPETRGFLNVARLARLKPGAIVVNVARGDLVDDDALIAALGTGKVFAAGLDVFNGEPRIDARYFDLPNVFMLPHAGSSTVETRRRMGRALIDGILAWQAGRPAGNRLV
jgi:glyoxylate reductase